MLTNICFRETTSSNIMILRNHDIFKSAIMKTQMETPEDLVRKDNQMQKELLDLIGGAFQTKGDAELAEMYCGPKSVECATCTSCGCRPKGMDKCRDVDE